MASATTRAIWLALWAGLGCACTQPFPELSLINEIADALGGRDRLARIQTFVIQGQGTKALIGETYTPDSDPPVARISDYTRTVDFVNGRSRLEEAHTSQLPCTTATLSQEIVGIDGDTVFTVPPDGTPAFLPERAARERRARMLHHPLLAVRAALNPTARVRNIRNGDNVQAVDITTATGESLTLTVDSRTKLPISIRSLEYHPNLGDVTVDTVFTGYEDVSGLRLPTEVTTRLDKYVETDIHVSRYAQDVGIADISVRHMVKSQELPEGAESRKVTVEQVGQGIWRLSGSGNVSSVVFEFSDHLTVFEIPLSESWARAILRAGESVRPGKPLTSAIVSHHHFVHSAAVRDAAAEGVKIITHRGNEAFFKQLVQRKHSIVWDALANALTRAPAPLDLTLVDDQLTLKDSSMEVRLYHAKDHPHAGTLLFAYVPRERLLVQADLYDASQPQVCGDSFLRTLDMRGLQFDRDVPVHGPIQTHSEVLSEIRRARR